MFVNVSNYPSSEWSKEQLDAAHKYGEIYDLLFPKITGYSSIEEIDALAKDYYNKIIALKPEAVSVAGEWCFSFALISALLRKNIKVLTACSYRNAVEKLDEKGVASKTSIYRFIKFIPVRFLED